MRYAFGDSDLAAERLRRLAAVFAGTSSAFLRSVVDEPPTLALDLGCGPGCTTHLVADTLRGERTLGMDSSSHFIALAESTATETVSFCRHDFRTAPFPCGPADLMYARYVLTHQTDPAEVVRVWCSQLRPGGRLLIEETDWIRTSRPAFATYLRIVEAMLADQGNVLYIGPSLDRHTPPAGVRRCSSRVETLVVPTHVAARMFHMNILTWKRNAYVQTSYSAQEIARLEHELEALAETGSEVSEIEWGLRQLVLQAA
jgi:trans-aconitate 2-methyltransferase